MTTMQQPKRDKECEKQDTPAREARIGEQVMRILGKPESLRGVQVRYLWSNHYRVNVFTGADAASTRVAHSYFVVADEDGNMVVSTPAIVQRYQQEVGAGAGNQFPYTASKP